MAIDSKSEKGCESPICLWVTRWLLIFLAVVHQSALSLGGLLRLSEYLISTVLLNYMAFD